MDALSSLASVDHPGDTWSVGVVIPAHDEEALVGSCVASVRRALASIEARRRWVVVIADRCRDRTIDVATRALEGDGVVLPRNAGAVGVARRMGVDALLDHFADVAPSRLWLLSTDADTRVPASWVQRQLMAASTGAAAVAGVVRVDSFDEHPPWAERRFVETYELRADGTHPHVHGANLGVRADAYLAAGGWHERALAEDHCLWGRIGEAGFARSAVADSFVVTSGRAVGRARGGFADTLRRTCETAA